jgi:hypothetical protein
METPKLRIQIDNTVNHNQNSRLEKACFGRRRPLIVAKKTGWAPCAVGKRIISAGAQKKFPNNPAKATFCGESELRSCG